MDPNSLINSMTVSGEVNGYWLEPEIISALTTGICILIVAFVGYFFGLRTYFRKREHEQITKRYIDEGLDRLSEIVDGASRVFISNHTVVSMTVLQVKDGGEANLPDKFDKFERQYLTLIPFYKIHNLLGDGVFKLAVLSILGFVEAYEKVFDTYVRSSLANLPNEQRQREEQLEVLHVYLNKSYDRLAKYSLVLQELQTVTSILEKEKALTWTNLSKFKKRPDVKQSVERLKKLLPELQSPPIMADINDYGNR